MKRHVPHLIELKEHAKFYTVLPNTAVLGLLSQKRYTAKSDRSQLPLWQVQSHPVIP